MNKIKHNIKILDELDLLNLDEFNNNNIKDTGGWKYYKHNGIDKPKYNEPVIGKTKDGWSEVVCLIIKDNIEYWVNNKNNVIKIQYWKYI